jgi:sulfur-carrier protein
MINILLFAGLKEKIGQDQLSWKGSGLTVSQLKEELLEKYQLSTELQAAMIAINEEFEDDSYILSEGDTVAFIPPVSGG